ncbi:MAG: GNAT family N-acetyltransferase, partial [Actinobacteria bacterium]|nr:GNAT family N-acetyltransferase [Actinomycetota bacterium]
LAVGLGLSMVAGASTRWTTASAWTALSARLLEALAAIDPPQGPPADDARSWRARVTIPNSPSALARLLRVLSLLQVNVVSVFSVRLGVDAQLVDLILQGPGDLGRATIVHGLDSVASNVIVARGAEHDAEDIATRVLNMSADLVGRPDAAPQAAADLVLADSWEVVGAADGDDTSSSVLRLQWTLEQHVLLRRAGAPFTSTEHNRASALLALVAALAESRGLEEGYGWAIELRDGARVWIRLARPEDSIGVAAMHERCSERSRYQRYFTPMNSWREENLRRISGGHRGATLVATSEKGDIVALGNVFPIGPDDATGAEIAVIVDDAWHGLGLGRHLLVRLVEVARTLGFATLLAYVLTENRVMTGLLESLDLGWQFDHVHDLGPSVLCMRAQLDTGAGS